MKLVRVQKNVVTAKQNGAAKRVKVSPAALAALADLHIDVDTKKWAKLILQINGFHGDDVSAQSLIDRTWDISNIRKQRLVHGIKRRIGEAGYLRWLNTKHAQVQPVLLPQGTPTQRLAYARKAAVTNALKECLRTGAAGGTRITVELVKSAQLVRYKSSTSENRDTYAGAYKGWAATEDHHHVAVPEDWRIRVLGKGLANAGGMLTLDAHQLTSHGEIELFEAIWVRQGRGYSGITHRGVIAQLHDEVFHGENVEAAISGVNRKFNAAGNLRSAQPYNLSIAQFVERYSKYTHEVSITDARDTGACEYGILSWCNTVGIDPADHAVPMGRILEAFQHSPWLEVRRTVVQAVKRHRRQKASA